MKIIKRVLLGAVALMVGLLIIIFILENRQPVVLALFGQSSAMLPLASFMVLSFLAGLVVGPLLGGAFYARLRYRLRLAQRRAPGSSQSTNSHEVPPAR